MPPGCQISGHVTIHEAKGWPCIGQDTALTRNASYSFRVNMSLKEREDPGLYLAISSAIYVNNVNTWSARTRWIIDMYGTQHSYM